MKFRESETPLTRIDPSDHTFRITTQSSFDDLTASIRRIGLLNPPVLAEKNTGFCVISGFRRIAACDALKWPAVRTRIVSAQQTPHECSLIAISANAVERPLNLVEQSRALCLLSRHSADKVQLYKSASALGLPHNPVIVRKLIALETLTPVIKRAILSGTLTLAMALELGQLDRVTGELFATLFSDLLLSLNKQREILTLITEIAKREDVPMRTILSEDPLRATYFSRELDRTQKTHALRDYLRCRRFPALAASEALFDHHRKKLELGHHIKIQPPRNFEGRSYTLSLSIEDLRDVEDLIGTLNKLRQNPSMQTLLDKDF